MAKEKTHFVYSTLANDQNYTNYGEKKVNDLPVAAGSVFVKGGAGVADKHGVTDLGIITEVDEDELAMLQANSEFKAHEERGFIKVMPKKVDTEKAVSDMSLDDPSGPLTESDYAEGKAPKAGAPVEDDE